MHTKNTHKKLFQKKKNLWQTVLSILFILATQVFISRWPNTKNTVFHIIKSCSGIDQFVVQVSAKLQMPLGSTVLWKLAGNKMHRLFAYILMKHMDGYSSKIKADIWSPAAKNWSMCPRVGRAPTARDENILNLDGDRSVSAPQTPKTLICAFSVGECHTLRVISVELCSSQNLYVYFNQIFFNQSLLGKSSSKPLY